MERGSRSLGGQERREEEVDKEEDVLEIFFYRIYEFLTFVTSVTSTSVTPFFFFYLIIQYSREG